MSYFHDQARHEVGNWYLCSICLSLLIYKNNGPRTFSSLQDTEPNLVKLRHFCKKGKSEAHSEIQYVSKELESFDENH